eukprot:7532093-Karenia_brevis.AAC.1
MAEGGSRKAEDRTGGTPHSKQPRIDDADEEASLSSELEQEPPKWAKRLLGKQDKMMKKLKSVTAKVDQAALDASSAKQQAYEAMQVAAAVEKDMENLRKDIKEAGASRSDVAEVVKAVMAEAYPALGNDVTPATSGGKGAGKGAKSIERSMRTL